MLCTLDSSPHLTRMEQLLVSDLRDSKRWVHVEALASEISPAVVGWVETKVRS